MKAPLSWLKDYVDINCSAVELKDKLFSCGFEVEEMTNLSIIDKIVVCKIVKIEKHPNADKLSVCQIDAGKYGMLQIITSATNVFEGAIVPVALDGSTLSNGEHIVNGELRGILSNGMFCSGEEIGITDDWYDGASTKGILIFKEDYTLGAEVKDVLELNDVMYDINVTANRPDCQSILGLAREVAAVLNKPLKMPDLTYSVDKKVSTKNTILVVNHAFDLCPRYKSHLVKDIKIKKSPLWIRRRLNKMGIRAINNIVDITNYVLLEIGQPMHAFDLSNLEGNKIDIRRAKENEQIITLDEKKFTLNENNLVICDNVKPVALAGIMGGLNSEIKDNTLDIVFESATFRRDNIRKTSRALGQRSDSSSRYEKGVDIYSPEIGLSRALNLVSTLKCGKIACDEYDLLDRIPQENIIRTTFKKVIDVLGIEVPNEEIVSILKRLFFKVEVDGENLTVTCPLYREDMDSYPDIAEEIIREYGYDKLTKSDFSGISPTVGGRTDEQQAIENVKNLLVGYGFNEIISYSFVSEKDYEIFETPKDGYDYKLIKIINPIGEDLAVMRTTLFPSIMKIVANNINRKNFEGRLFEFANVYITKYLPLYELPKERKTLSFALFGDNENFFTAKGIVDGLLNNFCYGENIEYKRCQVAFLHPTRCASIYVNNKCIGYVGQLNPIIAERIGIDKEVYGGEIDYETLADCFNDKILVKTVSKFPPIERDLAIVVDKETLCADCINCIKKNGGNYLESVDLFDIYEGNQISENKKSMAFKMVFVSNERTLNVEEVDTAIQNILKGLKDKLNADLR